MRIVLAASDLTKFFFLSFLSLSLSQTHNNTYMHTQTQTLSLSLSYFISLLFLKHTLWHIHVHAFTHTLFFFSLSFLSANVVNVMLECELCFTRKYIAWQISFCQIVSSFTWIFLCSLFLSLSLSLSLPCSSLSVFICVSCEFITAIKIELSEESQRPPAWRQHKLSLWKCNVGKCVFTLIGRKLIKIT